MDLNPFKGNMVVFYSCEPGAARDNWDSPSEKTVKLFKHLKKKSDKKTGEFFLPDVFDDFEVGYGSVEKTMAKRIRKRKFLDYHQKLRLKQNFELNEFTNNFHENQDGHYFIWIGNGDYSNVRE